MTSSPGSAFAAPGVSFSGMRIRILMYSASLNAETKRYTPEPPPFYVRQETLYYE